MKYIVWFKKFAFLWSLILFFFAAALIGFRQSADAQSAVSNRLDSGKLAQSVRKALSIPPKWQVNLVELNDSPVPGLMQGMMEFKMNENVHRQKIYVSSDTNYFIIGELYDQRVDLDQVRSNNVNLKGSASKGPENAPVTVVEFSDLQCASCKKAHETIKQDKLVENYGGRVQLVYKHFPLLPHHNWAQDAAVACECAKKQNPKAFWSMMDQIFEKQNDITPENLREKLSGFAKTAGVDVAKFQGCVDHRETLEKVTGDMNEGKGLGIGSTPTFLVNGRMVVGFRESGDLKEVINEFLAKK